MQGGDAVFPNGKFIGPWGKRDGAYRGRRHGSNSDVHNKRRCKRLARVETDTLQTLYRTTERELKKRLKNPEFHMGETDRAALPQMLIYVRPDLSGLVAGDLNADTILSRMIKSLGDQTYERKEAFENWAKPVLEGLLNNKD
ncbi:MAG: hypothetical protein VW122_14665, partial [Paracoccaceae bacterium]